jgi:hypothetical protein
MTGPAGAAEQTEQRNTPPAAAQTAPTVATTGPGQIFKNITHALTDDDLKNPAVVRLILDRMYTSETQRDEFKQYVGLYHASDKSAGILAEKLKTSVTNEILFGLCLTLGGAAFGLAQYFWAKADGKSAGDICVAVAVILIVGGIFARAIHGLKR